LRKPDQRLDQEEQVGDEAEDSVRRLEVRPAVPELVSFDDDEASEERAEGEDV
jgi:hypothetical protein